MRGFGKSLRKAAIQMPGAAASFNDYVPPYPVPPGQSGKPYRDGWDVNRAVEDGLQKSVWLFKVGKAISSNAARLPVIFRKGDRWTGDIIEEHPLLDLFNAKSSRYEAAQIFRRRLSLQVLFNRQGAFVEVVRNRIGDPIALYLLPAGYTWPIPDEETFVSAYRVQMPGKAWFDVPAESVIWIREPHPTDPYRGLTFMEACGLDVEVDWYARLYNRNFLQNDGRPGGLLVLKGEADDDDMEELRRRFLGRGGSAISGAGRVSVIEGDGAEFVDTAATPREAAYADALERAKDAILTAGGVPESIAGNASGRTFENADQEAENFWSETMLDHLTLIATGFDELDPDPKTFLSFNLDSVEVLQRRELKRRQMMLDEVKTYVRTPDEYREPVGLEPMGGAAAELWMPTGGLGIGASAAFDPLYLAALAARGMRSGTYGAAPTMIEAAWRSAGQQVKDLGVPDMVEETKGGEETTGDAASARNAGRVGAKAAGRRRGVMVALAPPPAVAEALSSFGTEPAEQLHVSLCCLPDDAADDPADYHRLRGALAAFCSQAPALDVRVGGVGRFHNPGASDVLWAAIDSPGLSETRARLVSALRAAGFEALTDHGYTPHLTLSYIGADEEATTELPVNLAWTATALTLAVDGQWEALPLGGGAVEWKGRRWQGKAGAPANGADEHPPGLPEVYLHGRQLGLSDLSEYVRTYNARLRNWRQSFERYLVAHFAHEERIVLEKLRGQKSRRALLELKQVDPGSVFNLDQHMAKIRADAADYIKGVEGDFAHAEAARLGVNFSAWSDPGLEAAYTEQLNRIGGIEQTTYDQIASALREGQDAGEGLSGLTSRVEQVFAQARGYRAEMIARTETATAATNATLAAANASGVAVGKQWIATDGEPCLQCAANVDAGQIPMAQGFPDGSSGPPGHPNCECCIVIGTTSLASSMQPPVPAFTTGSFLADGTFVPYTPTSEQIDQAGGELEAGPAPGEVTEGWRDFAPTPEQLKSAKADLSAVREQVRGQIAEQANQALGIMDSADAMSLTAPGDSAAGGEWDWFRNLSRPEQMRIRRYWMRTDAGGSKAHQVAERLASYLGRDMSGGSDVDAIMEEWVYLTRQVDASRSLLRAQVYLPKASGFGGQSVDSLFPNTSYSIEQLWLNNEDASHYLAWTRARETAQVAEEDAVRADLAGKRAVDPFATPTHGPSPLDMEYEDWASELARLEQEVAGDEFGGPSVQAAYDRLRELLPRPVENAWHDHPGWSEEDVYMAVVEGYLGAGS